MKARPHRAHGALPWRTLDAPLTGAERRQLQRSLHALLVWQKDLRAWTPCRSAPDALPFVALYAGGRLFGCMGSDEGSPGERLARAFLRALSDQRFAAVSRQGRGSLVASVSYMRGVRMRSEAELLAEVELGTQGIGLLPAAGGGPVILLPSVAREGGLTAPQLVATLLQKANLPAGADFSLFLFDTEMVVARLGARGTEAMAPVDAAAAWLARLVAADGKVAFAVDPRTGEARAIGPMHHGRSATVLQALALHGGHARRVAKGRAWLEREARAALGGRPIEGWPTDPAMVAGTLALAVLAGARLAPELAAFVASTPAVAKTPWHAAQVACALGAETPEPVWRACVADLETRPWSPWTTLAARVRGDGATLARAEAALVASVRSAGPYVGGVASGTPSGIPETAITAVTAEALGPSRRADARAAVRRARGFLERLQCSEAGPAMAHASCFGAFPASPVAMLLRGDVTAHAAIALHGAATAEPGRKTARREADPVR